MEDLIDYEFEFSDEHYEPKAKRQRRREKSSLAGHLSSPIYGEEIDMILNNDHSSFSCYRHKQLKSFFQRNNVKLSYKNYADPIAVVQKWAINAKNTSYKKEYKRCLDSIENWIYQKYHFSLPLINGGSINRTAYRESLQNKCVEIQTRLQVLYSDYEAKRRAEAIKDAVCFKDIDMGQLLSWNLNYFERDLSLLKIGGELVAFPTTLVLCGLDKLQSLFGLKLYWLLSDCFDRYPGSSIYTRGMEIYNTVLPLREKLGQDFFSFVSTMEALIIGWVVKQPDDIGCKKLYDTQLLECKKMLEDNNVEFCIEQLLPKSNSTNDILMGLELTGMFKVFGYPILEAKKLLDQLKQYGVKNKFVTNPSTITNVEGVMRREFIINYRKKHGHYPTISHCPSELKHTLESNKNIPQSLHENYKVWASVKFQKNLDYDYTPDVYELVKDSAAAVNLSAWGTMYDTCSYKILYGKPCPPSSRAEITQPRRVIQAFLEASEDEVRKQINLRERGIYDEEDHISVQCGKENELKPYHGRAFTKQTANQRFVQTSLEHNVSKKIFPYVPEQSMIDGEVRNLNRVLQQIKDMGETAEFVCLDLKKWCLFQRHETTVFASQMYDELFGLNGIYENSHLFFIGCNVFCNSRLSPPDYDDQGNPIPGNFFMNDLIGGLEGMQQKKWTHIAESSIRLAAEMCSQKVTIMGQGDNQVILLHFSRSEIHLSNQKREAFLSTLDVVFKDMNHELKEKETWYSKFLHEYSKVRNYKGIAVSGGTKKASSMVPEINDGLCSIHSSLSTINTMTESLAKSDYDADTAFIINQIMMSSYIQRKKLLEIDYQNESRIKEDISVSLLTPADFGGLPLSSYISHSIRGHDDKVTLWIDLIKCIQSLNDGLYKQILRVWQTSPQRPAGCAKERTRLYEDPYSLNIRSLPSAETEIKKYTKEFLMSDEVTNPSITRLYKTEVSLTLERVVEEIDKIEPMFPQLANAMLKNSNAGIITRLMQTMTSSKTIERIIKSKEEISLLDLISKKNDELKVEFVNRLRRNNSETNRVNIESSNCSYSIAVKLREYSWGRQLIGLTKPLYQHQVIIKDFDFTTDEEKHNCIYIQTSSQLLRNPLLCYRTYGEFKPYVGSSTQEKITKASIDVTEKTSFIKALIELGKIKTWLLMLNSFDLVQIIDIFINEKLDLVQLPDDAEDVLDICSKVQSGNIFHRFKSQVEHSYAMVNCLAPVTSHFNQSSNPMASRTIGGIDLSIFYQYVYINNILELVELGKVERDISPYYAAVFECTTCTHILPDANFKVVNPDSSYLNIAPCSSLTTRTVSRCPSNIREVMGYRIGRILAENIDVNFDIYHGSKSDGESLTPKKDIVSLNDLRELDIKLVLCTAFLFSTHCQKLLKEKNDSLLDLSFDQSFTFLGEILINSGFLDQVFILLGGKVLHHNMVTTAKRLSGHISRFFKNFLLTNLMFIREKILCITMRDDIGSWKIKAAFKTYCVLYKQINRDFSLQRIVGLINTSNNHGLVKKQLGIPSAYCNIKNNDVISIWRSSDKSTNKPARVIPKTYVINSVAPQMDINSIIGYHSLRNCERGTISIQPLSFLARPLGRISSACNKYIEIIISLNITSYFQSKESGHIYSLAEGSGGTLTALLALFPSLRGAYNTLMRYDIDPRDVATDCLPPAFVESGLSIDRLFSSSALATGETNILSARFLHKLVTNMSQSPPTIVTMDAESVNKTSNMEFVKALIPEILKFLPDLVIFKMFWTFDFYHEISCLVSPPYKFIMMKPISSNPVGNECFLVIARFELVETIQNWRVLERSWESNIGGDDGYLKTNLKMTETQINRYSEVATNVAGSLMSLFEGDDMLMTNKFQTTIASKQLCGLICYGMLDELMNIIDKIASNETDTSVFIVIREAGTNQTLYRLIHDLVFLIIVMGHRNESIGNLTSILAMITVKPNIDIVRRDRDLNFLSLSIEGSFWNDWGDAKMYCRYLTSTRECACRNGRYWSYEEEHSSLSWRIVNEISRIGLLRGDVRSMRVVVDQDEDMF